MKNLTRLLVLLLTSVCFATTPAVDKVSKASYQIAQESLADKAVCSATAIGPHALLTATHCEVPSDILLVRQTDSPYNIVARIRDGNDHTILLLDGDAFPVYVNVSLAGVQVADDAFTFGNPGDWEDVYQKGYVAAIESDHSMAAMFGQGSPDKILFDIQSFPGESGAGLFNSDGVLVAVLSGDVSQTANGMTIDLAAAYPLAFKPSDLDKAKTFVTGVK